MSLWEVTDQEASKPKNLTSAEKEAVFGVDENEIEAGSGRITSIGIDNPGAGYKIAPTVTLGGLGGSGATATAAITNGKVSNITITNSGDGNYTTATVVVAPHPPYTFDGVTAVDPGLDAITLPAHALDVGDELVYSNGGGTSIGGMTTGNTYYVSSFTVNSVSLSETYNGEVLDITAYGAGGFHTLTSELATANASLHSAIKGVQHAGWVKKTVGTGGRAGRVTYETLVAAGITTDAADDIILPDA